MVHFTKLQWSPDLEPYISGWLYGKICPWVWPCPRNSQGLQILTLIWSQFHLGLQWCMYLWDSLGLGIFYRRHSPRCRTRYIPVSPMFQGGYLQDKNYLGHLLWVMECKNRWMNANNCLYVQFSFIFHHKKVSFWRWPFFLVFWQGIVCESSSWGKLALHTRIFKLYIFRGTYWFFQCHLFLMTKPDFHLPTNINKTLTLLCHKCLWFFW